jgi:type IV pilus assembly protein PilW
LKRSIRLPKRNTLRRQRGVTLIELLVAMGLGLLVVAIAGAALLLGRQGYNAVDSSTQMRDRQRLAVDLITRTIVQTGFEDFGATTPTFRADGDTTLLEPDIFGWNNAIYTPPGGLLLSSITEITNGNRPSKCGSVSDTSCKNGSDILAVRYQGVTDPTDKTKPDNTILNCGGWGERGLTTNDLNERGASIFHVNTGADGEPSLYCAYYSHKNSGSAWVDSTPLIEGVESFQVLYGTDRVTPATAPVKDDPAQDSVAERWLRADQLSVAGNVAATRDNWRRVRAVRVGLVLRGPVGSAQQSIASTSTPLGSAYTDSANDVGTALAVSADGRLRTTFTFTVHVRNDLTTR